MVRGLFSAAPENSSLFSNLFNSSFSSISILSTEFLCLRWIEIRNEIGFQSFVFNRMLKSRFRILPISSWRKASPSSIELLGRLVGSQPASPPKKPLKFKTCWIISKRKPNETMKDKKVIGHLSWNQSQLKLVVSKSQNFSLLFFHF